MQPATVVRMFYKRHRVSRIPGTEKPVDNLFMFELFSKCRRFPTTVALRPFFADFASRRFFALSLAIRDLKFHHQISQDYHQPNHEIASSTPPRPI